MSKRGNGEGSIYQDGRGFYRAAITLDNGKRRYLSGKTRQDVAARLNTAIETRTKGLPLPGLRLTTARFLSDWLEQTVKPSQKPLTYEKYAQVVKSHVNPAIGSIPLARITPAHVQKIQGKMAGKGPERRHHQRHANSTQRSAEPGREVGSCRTELGSPGRRSADGRCGTSGARPGRGIGIPVCREKRRRDGIPVYDDALHGPTAWRSPRVALD